MVYSGKTVIASDTGGQLLKASTPDKIDLVLLLMAAPDSRGRISPLRGITRLQKLLYLVEKESDLDLSKLDREDRFDFKAYKYGPFAKEVYEAVDFLENADFLNATKGEHQDVYNREESLPIAEELDPNPDDDASVHPDVAPPKEERTFELTPTGKLLAERLRERLKEEDWESIQAIKRKYGDRSLSSLIAYVYRTYPESASETELRHLL